MTVVITAKLSLALRLVDTTTGKELEGTGISFFLDGKRTQPIKKGGATFVFVNLGREDFLMQIDAPGYDRADVKVIGTELDPKLPIIDVFLMPSEKNRIGGDVLEICGTLSRLEYIEAIRLDRPIAKFQSTQDKKDVHKMNLQPLQTGGGVILDTMAYALLSEDETRYDIFEVKKQDAPLSIILKEPLTAEHVLNDRIYRIIYGRAGPKGRFCLKVRDDGSTFSYLVHFKAGAYEYFRKVDFSDERGEIDLKEGAVKQKVTTKKEEDKENNKEKEEVKNE